jgi:sensor histidine kinase regulating citrate/malate metabolism
MDKASLRSCFYRNFNLSTLLSCHADQPFSTPLILVFCSLLLMSIAVACFLTANSQTAQFGVSPSQTSNFFNDFRGRSSKMKATAPCRSQRRCGL